MKPRVAVVFTGGTISMRVDPETGAAVPTPGEREILAQVPGPDQIADIEPIDFARLPGPHVTPDRMWALAAMLKPLLGSNDFTGIVVTHGTDTLEETAVLLDLVLDTETPVAVVGVDGAETPVCGAMRSAPSFRKTISQSSIN